MLCSIVDVGSNTVRFVTYEIKNKTFVTRFTDYKALELVSKIKNGKIFESAVNELCETLIKFKEYVLKDSDFYAFSTAFMRIIDNSTEILDVIRQRTGIELVILTEEEEALYSFKGVMRTSEQKSGVVIDLGGGSCEFIKYDNNEIKNFVSIPLGCVKLYDMFINENTFPNTNEIEKIQKYVYDEINKYDWLNSNETAIITGGTARAAAQLDNYLNNTRFPLSNYVFTFKSFDRLFNKLLKFDKKNTDFIVATMFSRIKTIYPGIIALKAIFDYTKSDNIIISTEGVREGYLEEKVIR